MSRIRSLSGWMLSFWISVTVFWVLFIVAAPNRGELFLRALLLPITLGLYLWLRAHRLPGEQEGDRIPERVVLLLGVLAILGGFGAIFVFHGPEERLSSAALALSALSVVMDNRRR